MLFIHYGRINFRRWVLLILLCTTKAEKGLRKSEVGSGRSNCEQPSSVFVVYSHPLLSGKVDFFLRGGLGGCTHASKNGHNCRLICRLRRIKLSTSKTCFPCDRPDRRSLFKKFREDINAWYDWQFPYMIVSIALKASDSES